MFPRGNSMEKMNLSDLLEPEHMDPVKRIVLIRIVDDDGGVRESYKFLIESVLFLSVFSPCF